MPLSFTEIDCFCLLVQWEINILRNFFMCVSNTRGSVGDFNDGSKNGRCTCPDVAGIQLELEEQARLLELLLTLPKRPIAHAKRPVELGSRTTAGYF